MPCNNIVQTPINKCANNSASNCMASGHRGPMIFIYRTKGTRQIYRRYSTIRPSHRWRLAVPPYTTRNEGLSNPIQLPKFQPRNRNSWRVASRREVWCTKFIGCANALWRWNWNFEISQIWEPWNFHCRLHLPPQEYKLHQSPGYCISASSIQRIVRLSELRGTAWISFENE